MLINKRESTGSKGIYPIKKLFFEYLDVMDDTNKNTEEYNPKKKQKILTLFDDMIADMVNNKKRNPIAYLLEEEN